MEEKVEQDTSHDFKKLFGPFWFFLYYLMGYPLRVLGCFLDGFVIYWLVYDVRESSWQAWSAAMIGALLIQVILGLSTTVSAKNLFRGLLFRSVAYSLMFLITAAFAGGSLYSTLYLSRNGSGYAVESFSPKLKQTTTTTARTANDKAVTRLVTQQTVEITQLENTLKAAKGELKTQIHGIKQNINKYQRIVNTYAEGETVPWEYRSPIINGQNELKKLNGKLADLATRHQENLAKTQQRHSEERTLVHKAGLASIDEVKTTNQTKAEKLNVYGLLAIGGNVGINLLSFFIMLGYELFLKFSQDQNQAPTPLRRKRKTKDDSHQNSEPDTVPTQQPTPTQELRASAKKPVAQGTQEKPRVGDGVLMLLPKTMIDYFPYEKHRKNARMSYSRAFQSAKDSATTRNRMATAQQHINALLWHGFDVATDQKDLTRLKVDALKQPTLQKKKWECVVALDDQGKPKLTKYEVMRKVG